MSLNAVHRFLVHSKYTGKVFAPIRIGYRRAIMRKIANQGKIQPNKIVFSSFRGASYSDNPKAISEMLHKLRPDLDIVWMFKNPEARRPYVPDYVRMTTNDIETQMRELSTARVWVDNFAKQPYMYLDKERQLYVNTWHGDRAFKKIGYDVEGKQDYRLEQDCHAMIAGSDFGERMMRSAFAFQGDIIKQGSPRNDRLVNDSAEEALQIRRRIGIPEDVRLLLYAPTFRDATAKKAEQQATMDLKRTIEALQKKTGDRWMCLFRAHYLQLKGLNLREVQDVLIDMTAYEDMTDLLLISDALLTDYSSCAMDFCLLKRPIFLFQSDIEDYVQNNREMYFDMADTPFWAAQDQAGLEALIQAATPKRAEENCREIERYFGFCETGHATEAVCDYIINNLEAHT